MATSRTHTTIAGAALVALGLLIRYCIGRRRFYRRNVAGLQTFSGYKWALFISLAERLGVLFANSCIIIGGLILAATQIIHHKFKNMKTNFFEKLAGLQNQSSLLLNIQPDEKGVLTVSAVLRRNSQTNDSLPPMLLSGTPQELDEAFFDTISAPVQQTNGLLNNIANYQASLEKAGKQAKEKSKAGKTAATAAEDDREDDTNTLFTNAPDDKAAKAEKKRLYDEQMQKVKTLAQQMKYAEALAQLPDAEEYPDKAELISAKREELENGKAIYDKLQNQFSD